MLLVGNSDGRFLLVYCLGGFDNLLRLLDLVALVASETVRPLISFLDLFEGFLALVIVLEGKAFQGRFLCVIMDGCNLVLPSLLIVGVVYSIQFEVYVASAQFQILLQAPHLVKCILR